MVSFGIRGTAEAFPDGARVPHPVVVQMRFEVPVVYLPTSEDPIPEVEVAQVLEAIRVRILRTMQAIEPPIQPVALRWSKPLMIAATGFVVWPLCSFLTLTANPSLEPPQARMVSRWTSAVFASASHRHGY